MFKKLQAAPVSSAPVVCSEALTPLYITPWPGETFGLSLPYLVPGLARSGEQQRFWLWGVSFLFRQCHISVIVSKTYHLVKYETLIFEIGL
jgi:hypothetical protein